MKPEDFLTLSVLTIEDFKRAGAEIDGMRFEAVHCMDQFALGLPDNAAVQLLHNGCNTGKHDSPEHPAGEAIDITIIGHQPPVWEVVCRLAYSGFKAIGVYLNYKGIYSYHADICRYRQWAQFIHEDGHREQVALIENLQRFLKK